MSSSNSPCAACKSLRRKCTQECAFAPYFPPDNPERFTFVHKVFGASNVAKLLNELSAAQRDDAVNSLAYEAQARLQDPVYGCVGFISVLQQKLKAIQSELSNAKKELATYVGPQAVQGMPPILTPHGVIAQQHQGNPYTSPVYPYHNMPPMTGIPTGAPHGSQLFMREPQQQHHHHHHHPHPHSQQHQILEAQQLVAAVAAREQQEMYGTYEQQQQQEFLRFNSGFELGSVSGSGFNQLSTAAAPAELMSPSLALGTFDNSYELQPQQGEHHHPPHHQLQAQLLLTPPQPQPPSQQLHRNQSESEEGRSVGPSC